MVHVVAFFGGAFNLREITLTTLIIKKCALGSETSIYNRRKYVFDPSNLKKLNIESDLLKVSKAHFRDLWLGTYFQTMLVWVLFL